MEENEGRRREQGTRGDAEAMKRVSKNERRVIAGIYNDSKKEQSNLFIEKKPLF